LFVPQVRKAETMIAINPSLTVGRVVAEFPALSRIFEELKIDYCCGGNRSLSEICSEKRIPVEHLVDRLAQAVVTSSDASSRNWLNAPLAELCEHIVKTHHDYLRRELPRLEAIIAKVVRAHRVNHPELAEVQEAYAELRGELEPHMMKEECILFPSIWYLETNQRPTDFPFGSLANPIRVMINEHDHAGDAMERLRKLTGDYTPPVGACNTYRVMLEGLSALERDLHEHVHKENSILFPRAVELEDKLGGSVQTTSDCGCQCATA
jgi:regulator of cell morphogenesis and NO signaling